MAIRDNREYFDLLEKAGELIRIKEEVDWDCEAGAISRKAMDLDAPMPLMENVKNYPGKRLAANLFTNFRRAAVAFGMDPDAGMIKIFEEYDKRIHNPIKPVLVKDAPCQENMIEGDKVNLFDFPAPMVHDGDGGRYMSTWQFISAKDPDTDWLNWGMYRQMIHNERTLGGLCGPNTDMGRIKAKYEARGQKMPFATVIGPDPASAFISSIVVPAGHSEVDYAGAIRQAPVEMVKCITSDITVPAHAEIIIEGEMLTDVEVDEGPFGEYSGYRSSPRMPRSVYRVKAITHRNNPVLTMANMSVPVDDCDICTAIGWRGEIKKLLEDQQYPITGVYCPPEGVIHLVVVGVKKPYNHIANQIGCCIFGSKFGGVWMNQLIVCDDDVNIYDMKEVTHAMAAKLNPRTGIEIMDRTPGHPLAPYLSLHDRTFYNGGKVIYDCTWPLDWDKEVEVPVKGSFTTVYPKDIQERVLANWRKYGYTTGP